MNEPRSHWPWLERYEWQMMVAIGRPVGSTMLHSVIQAFGYSASDKIREKINMQAPGNNFDTFVDILRCSRQTLYWASQWSFSLASLIIYPTLKPPCYGAHVLTFTAYWASLKSVMSIFLKQKAVDLLGKEDCLHVFSACASAARLNLPITCFAGKRRGTTTVPHSAFVSIAGREMEPDSAHGVCGEPETNFLTIIFLAAWSEYKVWGWCTVCIVGSFVKAPRKTSSAWNAGNTGRSAKICRACHYWRPISAAWFECYTTGHLRLTLWLTIDLLIFSSQQTQWVWWASGILQCCGWKICKNFKPMHLSYC